MSKHPAVRRSAAVSSSSFPFATLVKAMTLRPLPRPAGLSFVGFNLTFFPQFILGYLGMPRRYHYYAPEWQVWHVLSSAGASVLAVSLAIPGIYLLWSLKWGKLAGPNPWGAVGLEWMTPSPPPTENFSETPVVTWEAYEYSIEDEILAEEEHDLTPAGPHDGPMGGER